MTDSQRTLIAVLLDRSGSMETLKTDTEGGFNAFIDQQRSDSETLGKDTRVTLAQFDTEYEVVYTDRAIADVPSLALQPRGATALYDAVGRLITDIGAELAAQPDANRPGTVVIVVLTDGHENSSMEWSHGAVRSAIRRQETDYSWDFVFLGANMDAVETGRKLGFQPDKSITYEASEAGVEGVFAATAAYVSRRNAAPAGDLVAGFSDEDRRAAGGRSGPQKRD